MKNILKTKILIYVSLLLSLQCFGANEEATSVLFSKDISDPNVNKWNAGTWVSAGGEFLSLAEVADEVSKEQSTLRYIVRYAARAFGGWILEYKEGAIPGDVKYFTVWTRKGSDNAFGLDMVLKDGEGKDFKVGIPMEGREWKKHKIEIPKDKKGPFSVVSIIQNNWSDRNNPEPQERIMDICDLRVYTDLSKVEMKDRTYGAQTVFPVIGNTFFYKEENPSYKVAISSWLGEEVPVEISVNVVSAKGEKKELPRKSTSVLDGRVMSFDLPFKEPGAYTVITKVSGFANPIVLTNRYVVCLKPQELTEEQKKKSVYGINVHGGGYVGYEKFSRLGFDVVRDYAFNFHWMNRARGAGDYGGWPWYPKIVKAATDVGMLTAPCMMGGMPIEKNQETGRHVIVPINNAWRRCMAGIFVGFPDINFWELDNEKDAEVDVFSDAYGETHRVFAELLQAINPDALSVEQGSAGIYPEAAKKHVLSGAFKDLDVLNGHRYCGIYAPEVAKSNANTNRGLEDPVPQYLRDTWRIWKRNSGLDGKTRQVWVTEWGWDTRAGQIVSEWEQAAYCQRGYLLALGNGIDKLFWYWYYDSDTDNPQNFFDGCGIFDRFRQPKPVAAAFAALKHFLPADMKYVGFANLSPNAMAQIFELNGKYIAAAFKINKEKEDFVLKKQPKAEKVYDMFGKELSDRGSLKLDIAPTWYVGLDKNCDWIKQAPMDVNSEFYVRNVAGEDIRINVTDGGEYQIIPPKDWTVEKDGEEFVVKSPEGNKRGATELLVIGNNAGVKKEMVIDVDIVPEAFALGTSVGFDKKFSVTSKNQSKLHRKHTFEASVPEGWEVKPAVQSFEIDSGEKVDMQFELLRYTNIPASERERIPQLLVKNEKGLVIDTVPIAPRDREISRVKGIKVDGDLRDWTSKNQLPTWMIGPRGIDEESKLYFGYAEEGLYFALDIRDSKCFSSDPRSFWRATDCFELLLDTTPSYEVGQKWDFDNHQFWFCPLADENRAYAGMWGRCEGQEIRYDINAIKTVVKKNDKGYVMEVFIPASEIHGYKAEKGNTMAIAFTLAIQGYRAQREIYWPAGKRDSVTTSPWLWGRFKFVD